MTSVTGRVEPGTYTAQEAFTRLGCGRTLGYEMIHDGRLPAIRMGRRVLVPRAAIEQLLEHPQTTRCRATNNTP